MSSSPPSSVLQTPSVDSRKLPPTRSGRQRKQITKYGSMVGSDMLYGSDDERWEDAEEEDDEDDDESFGRAAQWDGEEEEEEEEEADEGEDEEDDDDEAPKSKASKSKTKTKAKTGKVDKAKKSKADKQARPRSSKSSTMPASSRSSGAFSTKSQVSIKTAGRAKAMTAPLKKCVLSPVISDAEDDTGRKEAVGHEEGEKDVLSDADDSTPDDAVDADNSRTDKIDKKAATTTAPGSKAAKPTKAPLLLTRSTATDPPTKSGKPALGPKGRGGGLQLAKKAEVPVAVAKKDAGKKEGGKKVELKPSKGLVAMKTTSKAVRKGQGGKAKKAAGHDDDEEEEEDAGSSQKHEGEVIGEDASADEAPTKALTKKAPRKANVKGDTTKAKVACAKAMVSKKVAADDVGSDDDEGEAAMPTAQAAGGEDRSEGSDTGMEVDSKAETPINKGKKSPKKARKRSESGDESTPKAKAAKRTSSDSSAASSKGSNSPAAAIKVTPAARYAIIESLTSPDLVKHMSFKSVASSFDNEPTSSQLSRHWRECLASDLRELFRCPSGSAGTSKKGKGGMNKEHRLAMWHAACGASDHVAWQKIAEEAEMTVGKLKRYFRETMVKEAKQFINQN